MSFDCHAHLNQDAKNGRVFHDRMNLPSGILLCLLELGHPDTPQKAEIVSKSKLVPSVFIKHITE